jgi:plasmid rolling circle replication initiator protein Rep
MERERIEKLEQDHRIEVEYLIGPDAASRFFACGRSVKYGWNKTTEKTFLLQARLCGYWFCPLCELRRKAVLKRRAEVATKQLQEAIPSTRWIKLHLTIPNCEMEDLRETIDAMPVGT